MQGICKVENLPRDCLPSSRKGRVLPGVLFRGKIFSGRMGFLPGRIDKVIGIFVR